MNTGRLALVVTLASASSPCRQPPRRAKPQVLVVAPDGSDSAPGTASQPLQSIQVAVDRLTVRWDGRTARGHVSAAGPHGQCARSDRRPYQHEHAIVNGAGLQPPNGDSGLIEITDSSNVAIDRLDVTGYRTTKKGIVPIGIYVHGHDSGITIAGNHVHDLGNDNNTLGSFNINAHGIAVYGDDPNASVSDLTISGNTVDNLHLGASETVVVNGNVDHWTISGNNIHDNDNIGIDAIGFESTLSGQYRYTTRNRARNGVIADNVVARIRSQGNPAYWEDGELVQLRRRYLRRRRHAHRDP